MLVLHRLTWTITNTKHIGEHTSQQQMASTAICSVLSLFTILQRFLLFTRWYTNWFLIGQPLTLDTSGSNPFKTAMNTLIYIASTIQRARKMRVATIQTQTRKFYASTRTGGPRMLVLHEPTRTDHQQRTQTRTAFSMTDGRDGYAHIFTISALFTILQYSYYLQNWTPTDSWPIDH